MRCTVGLLTGTDSAQTSLDFSLVSVPITRGSYPHDVVGGMSILKTISFLINFQKDILRRPSESLVLRHRPLLKGFIHKEFNVVPWLQP